MNPTCPYCGSNEDVQPADELVCSDLWFCATCQLEFEPDWS